MPEDTGKFAEKIGVVAHNSTVNIHNQNIGVSDNSGATPINWHEICRQLLEPRRRLTSNPSMPDESAKLEREQIYVPLALVQRTKPEKRNLGEYSPEAGTRLYEPQYEKKQRFEHEAFLTQILEQGKGKTKGKYIALIGEPGAGKTTLLQCIAFWVLEKNLGFPIWISLADLGRSGSWTDLQSYLFKNWLKNAVPQTQMIQAEAELTTQIQQGRVWLLLDGVDEVAVSGVQTLQTLAQKLTGWIAQSRVVLTCRLNVWQADYNALETFETYRLLDFDYPKQVHQFIDNFFAASEPRFLQETEILLSKGERLKAELDKAERGRLRDLVQNPLRLMLLCSTWQSEEGNLPQTKAGLYQQFVQQIYTWKQNCFSISTTEQKKLNNALGRLALRDIQEGVPRFRLLESFIIEELGAPDDENSSFYKAQQLGWLNHVGIAVESQSNEKVYAFFHATFEEYFAALSVNDWDFFLPRAHQNKPVKDKHTREKPYPIFESQWKEVILLWLGREDVKRKQKEEFIKALVKFRDGCRGFYHYQAYFLAAAGIAEFRECSRTDEVVAHIVRWSCDYGELLDRARVALQQIHRGKAIDALLNLITTSQGKDDEYYTRMLALESLGEIAVGNKRAIAALINFIANSQNEIRNRMQAAESLGKIDPGNERVIAALINFISRSEYESISSMAAYSLGEIAVGNETAIAALVNLIATFEYEHTYWAALESLGEIAVGNETAIEALVNLIANSQDESTRRQAASSLGKIAVGNETAIEALVNLIANSQDESTRRQAAESLGEIAVGNETAIEALVNLIATSQHEFTCSLAAYSLEQIDPGNENAVIAALLNLIDTSQHEFTRSWAAGRLVEIDPGNERAIAALVNSIATSQDERIRWQAAFSLGKIDPGNERAIAALINLIATSEDKYRLRAEDIENIENIENIMPWHENMMTRHQALRSLEKILSADQMAKVVIDLGSDSKPNDDRYGVISHCAQNMPYSAFYQAWHRRSYMKLAITFLQYDWWISLNALVALVCLVAFLRQFVEILTLGLTHKLPLTSALKLALIYTSGIALAFAEGIALGIAFAWVFAKTDCMVRLRRKIMKVIKRVRSKK
ncbi:HEAT repeat domain-containing protein [Tolypothrix sp. VBCCA 56010]|uniref:NACHT domain-containing protein n=1 Tax=Tolypothrix sp. VBCCA 56010 TaxID=3137731 RepID=UPI003D7E0903